ncbi:MAG: 50S ribosomal protein L11 methyltransferase [Verrucomicrobia bacterium]|nr:MAG: 50S ribosomal protein L11 methyltransferase [Verrucomicrobiota bacterium]
MSVLECRIAIRLEAGSSIEEILAEREDPRWMVIENTDLGRAWLTGFFEDREAAEAAWRVLAPLVKSQLEDAEPVLTRVADQDWKESYKAHFRAWHCGRIHWVPVWERDAYELPEGDVAVWLDPGMAFGTGNHETTRLCLERLTRISSELEAAGRPPSSVGMIDAGCGSGILAISAAALGFDPILAFDLDPEAVRVSRENAALNGLADRVVFEQADLRAGLHGRKARVVMANIQADVLMAGRDLLLGALDRGGELVLSGILGCELHEVRDCFDAFGPGFVSDSRSMEEWSDLLITRRDG